MAYVAMNISFLTVQFLPLFLNGVCRHEREVLLDHVWLSFLNGVCRHEQQLGKRPMFFGGKWDAANAEIQTQWQELDSQERDLKTKTPRLEPERYTDRAKEIVNKANPNLKAKHDRARLHLEREQQRKLAEQEKRKQEAKAQQEREKQAFFARKALREQGKHDEANKLLAESKTQSHKLRSR